MKPEAESWPLQRPVLVTRALDMSLGPRCTDFACTDFGFAQFCVGGGPASSVFGQVQLAAGGANSGQVQASLDRIPQNLPEPVRVPYLTKPGPNLTEGTLTADDVGPGSLV